MTNVGPTIRKLRRERSLTQGQLATYAGIDQSYLSKIENGLVGSVGIEIVARIAQTLGVTTDHLLERAGLLPSGQTVQETVEQQYGVDVNRLVALASQNEDIRRILIALPDVPAPEREILALFVEVIRDRYLPSKTAAAEAN